jgi:hypothetical protein
VVSMRVGAFIGETSGKADLRSIGQRPHRSNRSNRPGAGVALHASE